MGGPVELREEIGPAGPFKLPRRNGMDGMLRRRAGVLERLIHLGEQPVLVRAAETVGGRVLLGARAPSREAARHGIARMRFALGLDFDQRPFLRRFARDPLIGRSIRARPWLRISGRPDPFEALVCAICEQLIEYERAAAIERRILAALGRRWVAWDGGHSTLSDMPAAERLAGTSPALLQSFDLAGCRAVTLTRVAREVARGRIDLDDERHEEGWRRLRAIPGIGPWTIEMMALGGQGRHDQLPAGDLNLLKLVGRRLSGGDPQAVADEGQVREFFAPYEEWAGLAAVHAMSL